MVSDRSLYPASTLQKDFSYAILMIENNQALKTLFARDSVNLQ